jgi:hypothetical protein
MEGADLAAFIRKQNQQAELVCWTVVLLSNSQIKTEDRRIFAGHRVGFFQRNPAFQTAADYALKKANILSPRDESLDLADFALTPALAATLVAKPRLNVEERAWLLDQATAKTPRTLDKIARALAAKRAAADAESENKAHEPDVVPGNIVRELRPKTHGLLLIYPLVQPDKVPERKKNNVTVAPEEETRLDPSGSPVIGLALSFPSSESAKCVEYQVNKRWNPNLVEDESDDD